MGRPEIRAALRAATGRRAAAGIDLRSGAISVERYREIIRSESARIDELLDKLAGQQREEQRA